MPETRRRHISVILLITFCWLVTPKGFAHECHHSTEAAAIEHCAAGETTVKSECAACDLDFAVPENASVRHCFQQSARTFAYLNFLHHTLITISPEPPHNKAPPCAG